MSLLEPDNYFSRVSAISLESDLLARGYTHVLLDMDNTILSRATHSVPLDVMKWLGDAKRAGIRLCLLSNNWHRTPFATGEALGLPVVAKAMKPLPVGFTVASRKIGGTRADTVVVGDQPSTDVLGAHLAGMRAYLVAPLVEEGEPGHTRFVRALERAIIGTPEGPDPANACREKDRP